MDKHISKEKALNLIEHNDKVYHYADKQYEDIVYATTQKICKAVAEMPAADVQPVKRGKWLRSNSDSGFIVCSECKHEAYWDTDYGQQLFDYCPYCGARMDGDTE